MKKNLSLVHSICFLILILGLAVICGCGSNPTAGGSGPSWKPVGIPGFSAGTADCIDLYVYNGSPYISYRDNGTYGRATVMKYTGSTWEAVGAAGFSDGGVQYTSLFVYNGTPEVAYQDNAYSDRLTVMKYTGSTWEAIGSKGRATGPVKYISLYVYNGITYVVFEDTGDSSKRALAMIYDVSWSYLTVVSTATAEYTSLSISADGIPFVGYRDYFKSSRGTVQSYDEGLGSWDAVGGSAGFTSSMAQYTSLYVDGYTPYFAYTDGSVSNKATVMKYDGSWALVGSRGFTTGVAYDNSLYVNSGTPYIAFRDGANGDKATVMKYTGSTWEAVGSPGFSAGAAKYIALFVDNSTGQSIPYVAYRDQTNGDKATVMAYY